MLPSGFDTLVRANPRLRKHAWILVDQRRPDCAVYTSCGRYYAKCFASSRRREFQRELAALEYAHASHVPAPQIILARTAPGAGCLLVTAAATGRPFSDLACHLSTEDLCRAIEAVGAWLGACHSTRISPHTPLKLTTHARERARALRSAPAIVASLQRSGHLPPSAASTMAHCISAVGPRCLLSPLVPAHGDLNAEHAFLHQGPTGRWCCTPIDFGCAGRCRQEFDLIYPTLYILAHPAVVARFGLSQIPFADHPAVQSFTAGYRSRCELPLPWILAACHAICWHLEVAQACLAGHSCQGADGAGSALGTAIFWAELLREDLCVSKGRCPECGTPTSGQAWKRAGGPDLPAL